MRSNYRWIVVGLLFTAITFNYVDRTIFTLVAPCHSLLLWLDEVH